MTDRFRLDWYHLMDVVVVLVGARRPGVLAGGEGRRTGTFGRGARVGSLGGITLARLWQGSWIRLGGFITCSSIVLGQAFHTKVLGDGQERVELVLS